MQKFSSKDIDMRIYFKFPNGERVSVSPKEFFKMYWKTLMLIVVGLVYFVAGVFFFLKILL